MPIAHDGELIGEPPSRPWRAGSQSRVSRSTAKVGGPVYAAGTVVIAYPRPFPPLLHKLRVQRDALIARYQFTVMAFPIDVDFAPGHMRNINRLIHTHSALGVVVMDAGVRYFERLQVFVNNCAVESAPVVVFAEYPLHDFQRRWCEVTDRRVLVGWDSLMPWLIRRVA